VRVEEQRPKERGRARDDAKSEGASRNIHPKASLHECAQLTRVPLNEVLTGDPEPGKSSASGQARPADPPNRKPPRRGCKLAEAVPIAREAVPIARQELFPVQEGRPLEAHFSPLVTTRFSQSAELITLLNQCGNGLPELPRDSGATPAAATRDRGPSASERAHTASGGAPRSASSDQPRSGVLQGKLRDPQDPLGATHLDRQIGPSTRPRAWACCGGALLRSEGANFCD